MKDFQFYSHIFDKLVFYKNTKIYLLVCLLHVLCLAVEIAGTIASLEDSFSFYPLFHFIEFFVVGAPLYLKLLTAFNILVLFSWLLDTGLLLLATSYGLTIDELVNPQHYPYLFHKTEDGHAYGNPNNRGLVNNFKELLTS